MESKIETLVKFIGVCVVCAVKMTAYVLGIIALVRHIVG